MSKTLERRIYLKEFKAISNAISTYEDINLLSRHLVEGICRSFNVMGCSILLVEDRENQLIRISCYGISDQYAQAGPLMIDDRYQEFKNGEPVFFQDFQNDTRVQYPDAAKAEGIVSMLSVPIKFRETIIGLLKIYDDKPWTLHPEDLDAVCILARQLGLVIELNGLSNFLDRVRMALDNLPLRMLKEL